MRRPNDDGPTDANGSPTTRRRYLAGIAAAGTVALAGCGGGDGGGGDGNESAGDGSGSGNGMGSGDTTSSDSDPAGSCASQPLEFERHQFASNDGTALVSSEIPTVASVTFENQVNEITAPFEEGTASMSYGCARVDATIQEYEESGEFDSQVEITDRFDFAVDGARAFTYPNYEGDELPTNSNFYLPVEGGSIPIYVTIIRTGCRDASIVTYERLVESSQLV